MGKMDPYVIISHGRVYGDLRSQPINLKSIKGPTHKGGHKTPKWDWETTILYGGEVTKANCQEIDQIKFSIFEEDLTSSDLVGETQTLELHDIIMLGSQKTSVAKKDL